MRQETVAASASDGGGDATVDGDVDGGGDSSISFPDTGLGGDGSACARGCSSDLHDVIDCNDNVVQHVHRHRRLRRRRPARARTRARPRSTTRTRSAASTTRRSWISTTARARASSRSSRTRGTRPPRSTVDFNGTTLAERRELHAHPERQGAGLTYGAYAGAAPAGSGRDPLPRRHAGRRAALPDRDAPRARTRCSPAPASATRSTSRRTCPSSPTR